MTVGASPARDLRPQIREESSFFHEVQSRAGSLPQERRSSLCAGIEVTP